MEHVAQQTIWTTQTKLKHLGPYSLSLLESKIDPVLDLRLSLGLKAQTMVFIKHF